MVRQNRGRSIRCPPKQKQSKVIQQTSPKDKFCPICEESKARDLFVHLNCRHAYCYDCLRLTWNSDLYRTLTCPAPQCRDRVQFKIVGQVLSRSQFKRHKLWLRHNSDTNIACPNCPHKINLKDLYQCRACQTQLCQHCLTVLGPNHECPSSVTQSIEWVNQNTRGCPNCGMRISKDGGCDHMHCIACRSDFSWNHQSVDQRYWNREPRYREPRFREPEYQVEWNADRWYLRHEINQIVRPGRSILVVSLLFVCFALLIPYCFFFHGRRV